MFITHNLFHSKCLWCSRHTFVLHCTLHLAVTVTCIFKINTKKIETQLIPVIMEKCQMLRRKMLSLANLSLLESETIFSRKIISEKKLLLCIYAQRLSGHSWFNGWRKSLVTGLNWNPWVRERNIKLLLKTVNS